MIRDIPVAAAVMSWQQHDVVALVIGNRFSKRELEDFAVFTVFVIVAVVIVLGLIVFLLVARSRSRMPAPVQALSGQSVYTPPVQASAEPGWQPVDGDQTRITYWDGARFTAWKRWDGTNWVDWTR